MTDEKLPPTLLPNVFVEAGAKKPLRQASLVELLTMRIFGLGACLRAVLV